MYLEQWTVSTLYICVYEQSCIERVRIARTYLDIHGHWSAVYYKRGNVNM